MAAPIRFVYINNNKFKFLKNSKFIFRTEIKRWHTFSTKEYDSFKYCFDSVRKYDYENYLCTLLLPHTIRSSAFVIRAFNVEISQVRELVSTSAIGEMRLKFWHDTINKTFAGNPPEQPVARELAKEKIISDKPFLTIKEAEEYCDNSVASVYFLILQSLGVHNVDCDHAASHIGKAQGICNLIRGIPYNASKRRAFLPLELMSKHKISHEDLVRGKQKQKLQDAVYDMSSVAHQHLLMARKLSNELAANVKPVFLPAVAVATYLRKLQKTDFDVFHPKNQKRNSWLPVKLLLHKLRNKY